MESTAPISHPTMIEPTSFVGLKFKSDFVEAWYEGHVAEYNPKKYPLPFLIRYEDGDKEWASFTADYNQLIIYNDTRGLKWISPKPYGFIASPAPVNRKSGVAVVKCEVPQMPKFPQTDAEEAAAPKRGRPGKRDSTSRIEPEGKKAKGAPAEVATTKEVPASLKEEEPKTADAVRSPPAAAAVAPEKPIVKGSETPMDALLKELKQKIEENEALKGKVEDLLHAHSKPAKGRPSMSEDAEVKQLKEENKTLKAEVAEKQKKLTHMEKKLQLALTAIQEGLSSA